MSDTTRPTAGNAQQPAEIVAGADRSTARRNGTLSPRSPGWLTRRFPLTDLPTWLMLALVAVGLPRTVLADLNVVAPESSLAYYVLALTPFALWLAVAVRRRSRRPLRDFLVLGVLYGLSLVVVHQLLWDVGPSLGEHPPTGAVNFAATVSPSLYELAVRGYTVMIAMMIGVGTGLVAAVVAVVANALRSRR